ncbi:short-chain dehydrogenase [Desulfonema ishimotonii]|uniref:Short-chain dehydrogenase n=1 Tax=Desulfonema ishimotonii TaxID=45657 RepID=A0A401FQL0_9BACT|nr:SDR family oxidoreductase [Desulfonema ishimotonii]GBC59212.1 short-chain dehydrogenase [Desulfonema ishimotonii]
MVNFSLEGKTALITGASRGIGAALAKTLAEYGARCILVSRRIESLETVAEEIRENGGTADAIACNMGYTEQIKALFEEVKERFGRLDILVNNAAANPFFGQMIDADEGVWDKTHSVNLKGPFFMIQNAARLMKDSGGGAIVNVASVNGVRPGPFQGIYSITKAGLISMTQAFAKELASSNIRVNALLPGITETKFAKALIENKDFYNMAIQQVPMGRHAGPDEMAGAVLYLVSDAASFTTGTCIVCDGGYLA